MTPIIVTIEQHTIIRRLPMNTNEDDRKSIWMRVLQKKEMDPAIIERIFNGEKYEVEDE